MPDAATAFSIWRRITNRLNSSGSPSWVSGPPTKNWHISGRTLAESVPMASGSTGTSRHPRNLRPSSATTLSMICLQRAAWDGSRGRKTMPTPYAPRSGSSMPWLRHWRSKNSCGICTSIPAPSPVSGSAPAAPRCPRLISTSSPWAMTLCDLTPLMLATSPTPHASCSN